MCYACLVGAQVSVEESKGKRQVDDFDYKYAFDCYKCCRDILSVASVNSTLIDKRVKDMPTRRNVLPGSRTRVP